MSVLHHLAPVFLVFEVGQLVLAERFIGVRQIRTGTDPRELRLPEPVAALWLAGLLAYWGWIGVLFLARPLPVEVGLLALVTAAGLAVRRHVTVRWALVVMTFEGAVRIGMLLSLAAAAWGLRGGG